MDEELLKEVKKEIQKVSPAVDVSDGASGSRFGQWKIQQLLGRNSIGELYLAQKADDSAAGEMATLRSFDSSLSRNPRLVKRFLQEAEKAAEVDHPAVARVLDFGRTENGTAFMVRQYVKGETLQTMLKDGPVEVGKAIDIALAICNALEAADKCGLMHRSLNPSNVIIDNAGKVFVVDFGLSKSVPAEGRDTRGLTNYNDRREDMRYVSPEQIKEDRLDIRSDIYSLGCIINVLFTGEEILASLDGFRLLKAKMQGSIDSDSFKRMNFSGPPRERQKTSERAAIIVQRAISGDRKHRYESPAELAEDLNRLNKGKELQSATVAAVKEIESAGTSQTGRDKPEGQQTGIRLVVDSIKMPARLLIAALILILLYLGIKTAFPGLFASAPAHAVISQSPRPDGRV